MELKEVLAITIPSVLPTLMVLFGILSNKNDINHVRTELSSIRGEISNVRSELRAEINAMRNQFHADITGLRSDIATLVGITNDLDKRVSRLEDKG